MKRSLILLGLLLACGQSPREQAYQILSNGLKDHSKIVVINAAEVLARLDDNKALTIISDLTRDSDKQVVTAAIIALGRLQKSTCEKRIAELCQSDDPLVKTEAFTALTMYEDENTAAIFLNGLRDRIGKIRIISAQALGLLKIATAGTEIRRLLRDNDPYVRIAAAEALSQLGQTDAVNVIKKEMQKSSRTDYQLWPASIRALAGAQDTSSFQTIKEYTTNPTIPWEIRLAAAEALYEFGDRGGRTTLSEALKNSSVYVRSPALDIIIRVEDGTMVNDVKPLMNDPFINVVIPAVHYLGKYGSNETFSQLAKLLSHPNTYIQIAAAEEILKKMK